MPSLHDNSSSFHRNSIGMTSFSLQRTRDVQDDDNEEVRRLYYDAEKQEVEDEDSAHDMIRSHRNNHSLPNAEEVRLTAAYNSARKKVLKNGMHNKDGIFRSEVLSTFSISNRSNSSDDNNSRRSKSPENVYDEMHSGYLNARRRRRNIIYIVSVVCNIFLVILIIGLVIGLPNRNNKNSSSQQQEQQQNDQNPTPAPTKKVIASPTPKPSVQRTPHNNDHLSRKPNYLPPGSDPQPSHPTSNQHPHPKPHFAPVATPSPTSPPSHTALTFDPTMSPTTFTSEPTDWATEEDDIGDNSPIDSINAKINYIEAFKTLHSDMVFPIPDGTIISAFGPRVKPNCDHEFTSLKHCFEFHNGVDIIPSTKSMTSSSSIVEGDLGLGTTIQVPILASYDGIVTTVLAETGMPEEDQNDTQDHEEKELGVIIVEHDFFLFSDVEFVENKTTTKNFYSLYYYFAHEKAVNHYVSVQVKEGARVSGGDVLAYFFYYQDNNTDSNENATDPTAAIEPTTPPRLLHHELRIGTPCDEHIDTKNNDLQLPLDSDESISVVTKCGMGDDPALVDQLLEDYDVRISPMLLYPAPSASNGNAGVADTSDGDGEGLEISDDITLTLKVEITQKNDGVVRVKTPYRSAGNINKYIISLVDVNEGTTRLEHVIDLNKRIGLPLELTGDFTESNDIIIDTVHPYLNPAGFFVKENTDDDENGGEWTAIDLIVPAIWVHSKGKYEEFVITAEDVFGSFNFITFGLYDEWNKNPGTQTPSNNSDNNTDSNNSSTTIAPAPAPTTTGYSVPTAPTGPQHSNYVEAFTAMNLQGLFHWPLPSGKISATFGPQIRLDCNCYEFHRGVDLHGNETGIPISASYEGVVEAIVSDTGSSSGGVLMIRHTFDYDVIFHEDANPTNTWYTLYYHSTNWLVKEGEEVNGGHLLGLLNDNNQRLHHEVRIGTPCDLQQQITIADLIGTGGFDGNQTTCELTNYDPHVHAMYVYPRDLVGASSISIEILKNITETSDGVMKIRSPTQNPNINKYTIAVVNSNDGKTRLEHTLDLNLREGYDASTEERLYKHGDDDKPYLQPIRFDESQEYWTIRLIIPSKWVQYKSSDEEFFLTVEDIWGDFKFITFGRNDNIEWGVQP